MSIFGSLLEVLLEVKTFWRALILCMHGRPQGGGDGHFPPWKLGLRSKNVWKTWNQEFNSDYLD